MCRSWYEWRCYESWYLDVNANLFGGYIDERSDVLSYVSLSLYFIMASYFHWLVKSTELLLYTEDGIGLNDKKIFLQQIDYQPLKMSND